MDVRFHRYQTMKFFIFAIIFFTVVVSKAKSQESLADVEACAYEVGVKGVTRIPDNDRPIVPRDPIHECLRACIWKKQGVMKNGKFDPDLAYVHFQRLTRFSLEAFKEKFNFCIEKANQEANECDVVKIYVYCINGYVKTQN